MHLRNSCFVSPHSQGTFMPCRWNKDLETNENKWKMCLRFFGNARCKRAYDQRTHLNSRPTYTGYEMAYFAFTRKLISEMFILILSCREIMLRKIIKLQECWCKMWTNNGNTSFEGHLAASFKSWIVRGFSVFYKRVDVELTIAWRLHAWYRHIRHVNINWREDFPFLQRTYKSLLPAFHCVAFS